MIGRWIAMTLLASGAAVAADAPTGQELTIVPGTPIAATVDGRPARLLVGSGRVDRLTLDADYVAAATIKPTLLMGRVELSVGGRVEFEGRNRPVTLAVAGATRHARAYWFATAPDRGADGSVGPWGLPQDRVSFVLGSARADDTVFRLTLHGSPADNSYAIVGLDGQGIGLSFDVEDGERFPVATAAAGALIAKAFGGAVEGPSWDVEVLMGVKRPVRLLRLVQPMTIGPLSYDHIAVRVRDRIDASGRGAPIAELGQAPDPNEVVVTAKAGGPQPNHVLSIPRAGMAGCSRLTFDKKAKKIELACRPVPGT